MDSVVHFALEEICAQGSNGLTLPKLWPKLQSSFTSHGLYPCANVKKALWTNLLNIPGLRFDSRGISYDPHDSTIQSFEDCEKLNLKIVAPEHLRDGFVGIYDIKASDSGISDVQRRVLERLAIARTNGITQSELAKEFGIKGNNIFYILKNLECRGLIVRQSTILRTKETSTGREPKTSSIVNTNMLHLYRYAKHLGFQQRLEVIKEDKSLDVNNNEESTPYDSGMVEESVKENVQVKDYLPALKLICDKLEEADDKVRIVSDIKRDLGYCGTSGHRAWRHICHTLKEYCVVEEFPAKVNTKVVSCLRLLKKYSPKNFKPKALKSGSDDVDLEEPVKLGKRGQINEQIIELPIEHQIYDMIDAEGSKGLTITELCKRLGLNNKRYYPRLISMFKRFGMHLEPGSNKKGMAYRVWSDGNFNPEACNTLTVRPDSIPKEGGVSTQHVEKYQEDSTNSFQWEDHLTSLGDASATGEINTVVTESGLSQGLPAGGECTGIPCLNSLQNVSPEPNDIAPDDELQIVSKTPMSDISMDSHGASSTPRKRRSYLKYPCLNLSALNSQREHRIVELLQEEKFMIRAELHRHLEQLEKDKHTVMDRKTLERSLNKLQQKGLCKCIHIGVPTVTNCGRSRTMDVILHPSYESMSPELLSQIYERVRSFDMQIRNQGSSKLKTSQEVPVLNGVQRILSNVKLDNQAERAEAMRANGYVSAKMVRTKLLHIFLWGYLKKLPGWDDALSSGMHGYDQKNPHSSCKMIELDAAIKTMPLELFLQIVGSTHKFEDLIEKCKSGLSISDITVQEYKHLMSTQATGRLSNLIQILRGLKLIRMVSREHSGDAAAVLNTTLTYSLELKPYIEEPVSIAPSSSACESLDIRPYFRHDFVLSNRKAVDEYWNTLEYCYAAVDPKAALQAFPGSAVHEVYLIRSWASARVMTATQRAELLKRIMKDDPDKKLPFSECEKIAKDLNLTLEQVLRFYYDKRQKRLTRLKGTLSPGEVIEPPDIVCVSSSRKRKRRSERKLLKHGKPDSVESVLPTISSDTDDKFIDGQSSPTTLSSEQEHHLLNDQVDEDMEATAEVGLQEDDGDHPFVSTCALSRTRPTRRRKFIWTESADRQLVMEYARNRAALGAKFHRTDWNAVPNVPAPPGVCRRRMALLNSSIQFRKAVLELCNILTERYAKHLSKFNNKSILSGEGRVMVRNNSSADNNAGKDSGAHEQNQESYSEDQWDDFNNKDVEMALDAALRHKRSAKLDTPREVHSVPDECPHLPVDGEQNDPKLVSSAISSKGSQKRRVRINLSGRRSGYRNLQQKYIKFLNDGVDVSRRAYRSLAVSNAVELFKLVFLNASTAPEVPNLLAETLRRYSEHDLFAAFSYLREAKIMVGGSGTSPFVLSQQFIHRISSSLYPTNTAKRAAKFGSWIHENEKKLMEEGIDLPANLQCGDVVYLSALLSSRELLISPFLPDQGVGDADDSRTSKRKCDSDEIGCNDKAKKTKSALTGEGEIISRREKGFPGIRLSLSRATISRVDLVELFKDRDIRSDIFICSRNEQDSSLHIGSTSTDPLKEVLDLGTAIGTAIPSTVSGGDTPWEAMTCYAKSLMYLAPNQDRGSSFCSQVFKTVYSAIQKAGDQGLSMEEISKVMNIRGDKMAETIVEVLEAFGRALKVNGYDSVHVVDSLYRSKYCLTSLVGLCQDHKKDQSTNSRFINDEQQKIIQQDDHENDAANVQDLSMKDSNAHRVTILNLPEDIQASSKAPSVEKTESCQQTSNFLEMYQEDDTRKLHHGSSSLSRAILPWMNGDGTINEVVYKGLIRRVLGILMQNPGMLEVDILNRMDVLNPQSCRKLLELLILDNTIIVRKMLQTTSCEPPAILGGLIGSSFKKSKLMYREHFLANPMCATLL